MSLHVTLWGVPGISETPAPKVIVTTAYSEYALEGYELNVTDYLLKLFSSDCFLKPINKATGRRKAPLPPAAPAKQPADKPTADERIFPQADKKLIQVATADILYIEAAGNYCKVVTAPDTILIRETLTALMQRLPTRRFIQVHRSYAVALPHISSIEGNRISMTEYEVPVGRPYRHAVKRILGE
ncbi:MAG: LytTR family DNA-binding domain-containing protein [Cyclobacteriaceae bacterium]